VTAMPQSVRCPICRSQAPWQGNPHRPFCSERCKLQDLGAWASERYRIRGESSEESDEIEESEDSEGRRESGSRRDPTAIGGAQPRSGERRTGRMRQHNR
jgi:uncharacterized protein